MYLMEKVSSRQFARESEVSRVREVRDIKSNSSKFLVPERSNFRNFVRRESVVKLLVVVFWLSHITSSTKFVKEERQWNPAFVSSEQL
jgi:hypothetical protein